MSTDRRSWIKWLLAVVVAVAAGVAVLRWKWHRSSGLEFVLYDPAEVAEVKNVHDYEGRPLCQACHPGRAGQLVADAIALCGRCHAFEEHQSHPVGVVQKQPVKLPLGEGQIIVCHSCHDPHQDMRHELGLRKPFTPLCLECHPRH